MESVEFPEQGLRGKVQQKEKKRRERQRELEER
jgi:hypothetical protein